MARVFHNPAHLVDVLQPVLSRWQQALDGTFWLWPRPFIRHDKRHAQPDLVLYSPATGILIVDVCRWRAQDVVSAGGGWVRVREAGAVSAHRPPEEALGHAAELLLARLRLDPELARAPVHCGLVFTAASRQEINHMAVAGVLQRPTQCIAAGDPIPQAIVRLGQSTDAAPRHDRVRAVLEPQLHFFDLRPPAQPEADTIPMPEPAAAGETAAPTELPGFFLDRKQERMARELSARRSLVYGPAGSGKTVFLMARAQYWLDGKPDARVLLTCYNASLAAHIRKVFTLKGRPPDDLRLTVLHYHDLCQRLLGHGESFHERDQSFYDTLETRLLRELSERDDLHAYDLILVDEGQDFTRRMVEVLVRLNTNGGEITMVADPAQDIYLRWRESNLDPLSPFDVEHLVDCYRNTAPIYALARAVLSPATRKLMGLDRLELTRPEDLGRDGDAPVVHAVESLNGLADCIQEELARLEAANLPPSQLAVLYTDRHAVPGFSSLLSRSGWPEAGDPKYREPGDDVEFPSASTTGSIAPAPASTETRPPAERGHFAEALEAELLRRGIPVEWVTRDFSAKNTFDIAKPRLVLSTVHSAKGMDFHSVLFLGADTLSLKDRERSAALLFTGITRARERLVFPHFGPGGWIPHIQAALADSAQ